MGREFDAFAGYPEPSSPRLVGPNLRTIHNRIAASYREQEFYDGDRANGYGGFKDDGRWVPIAKHIFEHYGLWEGANVLQIGSHKGFLLHELYKLGCRVTGTEISHYAAGQSLLKPVVTKTWTDLPFEDKTFDLVIATSVVYNLNLRDAIICLKEIQRVGKGKAWITLAAYEDEDDIEGLMLLRYWFLLGTTILTKADWKVVMDHAGYEGDYRFDTAKYLNLKRA